MDYAGGDLLGGERHKVMVLGSGQNMWARALPLLLLKSVFLQTFFWYRCL